MDLQIFTKFSTIAHVIAQQWEKDSVVNQTLIAQYPFHLAWDELIVAIDEWTKSINGDSEVDVNLPSELEGKIKEWVKVGRVISENWKEEWNEKYPFDKDFMDILYNMDYWGEEVVA